MHKRPDVRPPKITRDEIESIVAKAPERPEGSAAFDMTFAEARDAAVKIAEERSEDQLRNQIRATKQVGLFVGAYHAGLTEAGTPEDLARDLTTSYHEWIMEQMGHASAGIRAVRK